MEDSISSARHFQHALHAEEEKQTHTLEVADGSKNKDDSSQPASAVLTKPRRRRSNSSINILLVTL